LDQGVVDSRGDPDAPCAFDEVGRLLAEPDRLDGAQTFFPICEIVPSAEFATQT
jgi:hypothetical protein